MASLGQHHVFDLTGPKFQPKTSRSIDERVTARLAEMIFLKRFIPERNNMTRVRIETTVDTATYWVVLKMTF